MSVLLEIERDELDTLHGDVGARKAKMQMVWMVWNGCVVV